MPKPNRDQVKVSHYISRAGVLEVEGVAEAEQSSKADAFRLLLKLGLRAYREGHR